MWCIRERDVRSFHLLMNWSPFSSECRSMNLMSRSHSRGDRVTYLASIPEGFPLTKFALTSTDWRTPSSSIMLNPVISPTSPDESKTKGCSNLKYGDPVRPVPRLGQPDVQDRPLVRPLDELDAVGLTIRITGLKLCAFDFMVAS